MSQIFSLHPDNPQSRLLRQAVSIIQKGGIVVYPTDSGFAIGCQLGDKKALERIRRIRQLDRDHLMTLMCRDLSELSKYAKVNNTVFRLLKAFTPGSYTFLLPATPEVPRLMMHPKRRTIGLRIPDHPITLAMLEELGQPLMTTTMVLPGMEFPLSEIESIRDIVGPHVDLFIDVEGGTCGNTPTTVVDLSTDDIKVLRVGKGDPKPFMID